jgi:hypothetical protein
MRWRIKAIVMIMDEFAGEREYIPLLTGRGDP